MACYSGTLEHWTTIWLPEEIPNRRHKTTTNISNILYLTCDFQEQTHHLSEQWIVNTARDIFWTENRITQLLKFGAENHSYRSNNKMSLESRRATTFSIVLGFFSFVVFFAFQQMFHERVSRGVFKSLMPRTRAEVYSNFTLPNRHSIVISRTWQFVAAYQWIWSLYSLLTIFRREAINVLPTHFYICWSASCYFEICQLLLISRGSMLLSWICLCAGAICRNGCLFMAFVGLFQFLAAYSSKHRSADKFDVWCQRILIQNGLLCFQAWSSLTACVDFGASLTRIAGLTAHLASYCGLLIFALGVFVWFVLQNFYHEKYTRYTIAEYLTFIALLSQMFALNRTQVDGGYAICLLLVFFSVLLFAFRFSLIIFNESKRKYASDEELEYMI